MAGLADRLAEHQAAAVTFLDAAVAPKHAYAPDEVPSPLPAEYVEVLVAEMYTAPDDLLLDATTNVRRYRVTVWWFSQTATSNAQSLRDHCFEALRFARLTVAGETFPPTQFEGTEDEVSQIEGWFVGSASFTY
jgi:hypothetical protein